MGRSKQTSRKSTGGKAPRLQLATSASIELRTFMTTQQSARDSRSTTSYLNCENVFDGFGFEVAATFEDFKPQYSLATVANAQTGLPETWLGCQFTSRFDGEGFKENTRPPLSLVLVLDISGSMSCALERGTFDNSFARGSYDGSKLEAAKRSLLAILEQLESNDSVGVLLFNHETHMLHQPSAATTKAKASIAKKLAEVRPGGGTRLENGFNEGLTTLANAAGDHPLKRVYFLTDMESGPEDEAAVLQKAKEAADAALASATYNPGAATVTTATPLHTTVIGMGVDLSVKTVEAISSLRGGKYTSVATVEEFERAVGAEFNHDVTPMAFDINITLGNGWTIDRACGSAELNTLKPGESTAKIASEFAMPHDANGRARGGIIAFKLKPPETAADAGNLVIGSKWTTLEGQPVQAPTVSLTVPPAGPTSQIASASLRKALALVRFVDLQKSFCDAGSADEENDLDGRLSRLAGYKAAAGAPRGDGLPWRGFDRSRRLQLLLPPDARADHRFRDEGDGGASEGQGGAGGAPAQCAQGDPGDGKWGPAKANVVESSHMIAAAAAGHGPSSRKRTHSEVEEADKKAPKELMCPILQTLMTDPVTTSDGHTFERVAIERWLEAHNTSPLTGLRLKNKELTPNHAVRSLAAAFMNGLQPLSKVSLKMRGSPSGA